MRSSDICSGSSQTRVHQQLASVPILALDAQAQAQHAHTAPSDSPCMPPGHAPSHKACASGSSSIGYEELVLQGPAAVAESGKAGRLSLQGHRGALTQHAALCARTTGMQMRMESCSMSFVL